MTLVYRRFAFSIGFDIKGNWVTSNAGTRVYVPLGLLYEPRTDKSDYMVGVSALFVLAAVLVRRRA